MTRALTVRDRLSLGSPKRRASRHPSIKRLEHIAVRLTGGGDLMLGLTVDDLIAAGWLGFVEASKRARTLSYGYQRARWAMIDEMRRWYEAHQHSGKHWVRPYITALSPDLEYPRNDCRSELAAWAKTDIRAFCARLLSPRSAELMIGLLVEGESLELMAERQGRSREAAGVARSQAIRRLTDALAA